LTKSYSTTQGQVNEISIPVCTLKLFPTAIHHTLQWAKELFGDYFTLQPKLVIDYLKSPNEFIQKLNETNKSEAQSVYNALIDGTLVTFEDCLNWAIKKWKFNFHEIIKNVLKDYPENYISDNGLPIWTGNKHCPKLLEFNSSNQEHFQFVKSAASLIASVYSIELINDDKQVIELINKLKINELHLEQDISLEELKSILLSVQFPKFNLKSIEFEKDDDLHMEFIVNCSNLRAENYSILKVDKLKSKQISGRITPAIATTTSLVVGLNCIELYKVLFIFFVFIYPIVFI
jgi:ubiquitin-activating enzyme E1